MKKIITALALCSVVLGLASCTRGGNIDRGNGGYIGDRDGHREDTTYRADTDAGENRRDYDGYMDGELGNDIYNIPHDVRRGIDRAGDDIRDGINDAGDDVHNGLKNAEDNIRRGLNLGGNTYDNRNVIK